MVRVAAGLADMLIQPEINVRKPQPTVLASARDDRSISFLGPRWVFEMQSLQMVLESVTTAKDPRLVTVGGFKTQGLRLVRVNFHIQLN